MNNNATETTCHGVFYDSGGTPADQPNCTPPPGFSCTPPGDNENFTKTFRPINSASEKIRINFTTFIIEKTPPLPANPFDRMEIYDGNSTSAPLIGIFFPRTDNTGTRPGLITSTAVDGSLTIKWVSDSGGQPFEGWAADISCASAYNPTFQTTGQSMWGSGTTATLPNSARVEFLTIPLNNSNLAGDVRTILGQSFGARLFGGIDGVLGFQIRLANIGTGNVQVAYPAQLTLSGPPPDSYRPGDVITIESAFRLRSESNPIVKVDSPKVDMLVDGRFGISAGAGAEACLFNCKRFNAFPPFNLGGTFNIVKLEAINNVVASVSSAAVTIVAEVLGGSALPFTIPAIIAVPTGIGGVLDLPNISVPGTPGTTSVVGGSSLVANGDRQFTTLNMDVDTWILRALGTPVGVSLESPCVPQLGCTDPPGEIPLNLGGFPIPIFVRFRILDLKLDIDFHELFTYTFLPTVRVTLAFPQPVQFQIRRGGAVIHSATSTMANLLPGDSIDLVVPPDVLNSIPTFSLINTTFSTETSTRFVRSIRESALQAGVRVPGIQVGCFPRVCFGFLGCTPAFCVSSPEIKLNLGPLINLDIPFQESSDTRLFQKPQHLFSLGGFNAVQGAPYDIDPEFQPVAHIDGPSGSVNEGDVVPFSAAGSTDGDNNPLTYSWDWGDGGTGMGPTTGEIVTHAYGDNGTFIVTLTADDGHGLPGVTTFEVTVLNVPPTITPLVSPPPFVDVDEGRLATVVTVATDPGFLDSFQTIVEWGDTTIGGGFKTAFQGPLQSADHYYADDGVYPVRVCVTDDDGGQDCVDLPDFHVHNVTPTCEVFPTVSKSVADPGAAMDVSLSLVGKFNDLGTLDTHNAPAGRSRIDWGDATDDTFVLTESPVGPSGSPFGANGIGFDSFAHTYTTPGTYPVRMCVKDDDGDEGCTPITDLDVPLADLVLTKEVINPVPPDPVTIGAEVRYSLTVANNGPGDVPDVRLTDVLPAGTELVSAVRGLPDPSAPGLETKLFASDRGREDSTGESLDIRGSTIILGSPFHSEANGVAFVFEAEAGGGWSETQKLFPSDAQEFDQFVFGTDVGIDGDTIVAGTPNWFAQTDFISTGAAYVFHRFGGIWTEQPILTASDAAVGDGFGHSVAVAGDTIVVGAPGNGTGAAYVFKRVANVWSEEQILTDATTEQFGFDVAISGDTLVVAARSDVGLARTGSVSVYRWDGSMWAFEQKITEADVTMLTEAFTLANSVAIDGDTMVIGTQENSLPGAAHVFTRSGTVWSEQAKLVASDPTFGDRFGVSVDVRGDTAMVGAPQAMGPGGASNQGAAYVFGRTGSVWTQRSKLSASSGNSGDRMGTSVGVEAETFVAGAPAVEDVDLSGTINPGAAFVFAVCPEQPIGTVTCGLGTIAAGESVIVEIVVRAGCLLTVGDVLTNSASVFGLALEDVPGDNTDTADVTTTTSVVDACGVDATPPLVSAVVTGTLGDNGWYTSDVSVDWVLIDVDSLISVQTGCSPETVSADTSGVSFTCMATSNGGTTSETVTIKRDTTPPSIAPVVAGTLGSGGWYVSDVDVSFTCTDDGSGIASCTAPSVLSDEGVIPPVVGTVVDNAGLAATASTSPIKIDKTPPSITAIRLPSSNGNGWNNSDVTVSFSCADIISGIDDCSLPTIFSAEGVGQSVTGTATDVAGLQATLLVDNINVDKTSPTIMAGVDPLPNVNGWNNTFVTVSFTCHDTLSGVDTCTGDTILDMEGTGQSAGGTVVDLAGNTAMTEATGIDIDFTPPTITALVTPAPDGDGRNDPPVTVSLTCNDDRSGVQSCTSPIVLTDFGFGQSAQGSAADFAGNTADASADGIDIGRPVVSPAADLTGNEGELLSVVLGNVAPVGATLGTPTIEWGDGSPVESATSVVAGVPSSINGTHVYADDGVYTMAICVNDLDGLPVCAQLEASIGNETPVLAPVDLPNGPVELGTEIRATTAFNDPGTADTHMATVDWGEGNPPEPFEVIETPFGPPGNVQGLNAEAPADHTYTAAGDYMGQVCVTDDEGATQCMDFAVSVREISPPSCTIEIGAVQCDGVRATLPLTVRVQNARGLPVAFQWASGNPNGTPMTEFDDSTTQSPTLVTDAPEGFDIFCDALFPDNSALEPVRCQTTVARSTFRGVDGCDQVIPCDPVLETVDIICPPVITLSRGDHLCNNGANDWLRDVSFTGGDPTIANNLTLTTDAPACGFANGTTTDVIFRATDECGNERSCVSAITIRNAARPSIDKKGSLLVFPNVEIKWDAAGHIIQDTVLEISNDYPGAVDVQFFFINGDTELDEVRNEAGHVIQAFEPGWNTSDCRMTLTPDQPHYWSAAHGAGARNGCGPFTVLDKEGPGRPDPETGGSTRLLRGTVMLLAVRFVDNQWTEIRWNHLTGTANMVDYANGTAWNYKPYAFGSHCVGLGEPLLDCTRYDETNGVCCAAEPITGRLDMDAFQYDVAFDRLLLDYYGSGSTVLSGGDETVMIDTELTLHPVSADFRQDGCGPVLTQIQADVWNEFESKFSGTRRCVCCWDQAWLSDWAQSAAIPNHFTQAALRTDKGKARLDGRASSECDYANACGAAALEKRLTCASSVSAGSQDSPLLGVAMKLLAFSPSGKQANAGMNLVGTGSESAFIYWDSDVVTDEARETPQRGGKQRVR